MQADNKPNLLGVSAQGSERRFVIVLFSDLCGSTSISARLEPEIFAEVIERVRRAVYQIVPRHSGQIVRVDGDGFMCVFGYPEVLEDSGRRAVEASLELHKAVKEIDFTDIGEPLKFTLHSGIHAGMSLIKQGDIIRGKLELLGEVTNIAARVCDASSADEILVTRQVLGLDVNFFHMGLMTNLKVRGRSGSLEVFPVLGRKDVETRDAARKTSRLTPFVGRRTELNRLETAFNTACNGGCRTSLLVGPPGIGKTRLLNRFLEHVEADGAVILRGYCESYLATQTLQPISQIARALRAQLGNDVRLANKAAEVHTTSSAQIAFELVDASAIATELSDTLNSIDSDLPLIIAIDDWQWADEGSRHAVLAMQKMITRQVWFILASRTFKPDDPFTRIDEVVTVPTLSDQEARVSIASIMTTKNNFLVSEILQRAGGSPLFIEELCHAARRNSDLPEGDADGGWLDMLIMARFAKLNLDAARRVKAAAVIGNIIPEWLLEAALGEAASDQQLSGLAQADFIFQGTSKGTLQFKHGLTREAVYRAIGRLERNGLHARVFAALQQQGKGDDTSAPVDALCYHARGAELWDEALLYSIKAGNIALARSSLDRAQRHFRVALEAVTQLGRTPDRAEAELEALKKYGASCVVDPSLEQLPTLDRALERACRFDNIEAQAWIQYWSGFISYGLGSLRPAVSKLKAALLLAEVIQDQKLVLTIRATFGQALAAASDYSRGLDVLDDVIAAKRASRKASRPSIVLSYTLACRASVLADMGQFERAYGQFDEAIDALVGLDHEMRASVLTLRCAACHWQGRFEEAHALAEASRLIAERAHARYIAVNCNSLAGFAQWSKTRDPAALETVTIATRWLETSGSRQFSSLNFGWLAQAMQHEGDREKVRYYSARAFDRARQGDRWGEAMAARALAREALVDHEIHQARRYLALAQRSASHRQSMHECAHNFTLEAEIEFKAGQSTRARHLIDEANQLFEKMEMTAFIRPVVSTEQGHIR
jgi:class 3 adenylate cyclase/tetratricopeptide (TPR) repeat protein